MGDQDAVQPVVIQNRQLKAQPFRPDKDDQLGTGRAWEAWLEGIEREFKFLKITEDQDKVDAVVIYGGDAIARLEKSLPNSPDLDAPAQSLTGYEKLKTKLNEYCTSYPRETSIMPDTSSVVYDP